MKINERILKENGFEIVNYNSPILIWNIWTPDDMKIDIILNSEYNNSFKCHHVHIDNSSCNSIGSIELDTVDEFNYFMKALGSEFVMKC